MTTERLLTSAPTEAGERLLTSAPTAATAGDWEAAQARANLCEEYRRLRAGGMSLRMAAGMLGKAASYFSGEECDVARYARGGVAALLPARRGVGAGVNPGALTAWIEGTGWFIPAARHFYFLTNRLCDRGSVAEAVRKVISLPHVPFGWKDSDVASLARAIGEKYEGRRMNDETDGAGLADAPSAFSLQPSALLPTCPAEWREVILARQAAGQPLVPVRVARRIAVSASQVRYQRNPTEWALDYQSTGGGLRLFRDVVSGEMRLARAMEIVEGDDATINFPVCVPWNRGGTECADKFGVLVGRFQWLVFIDVGTSMVLGFSYTMRPRSSYRAEDVVTAQRIICRQHGIPQVWRFEQGVWKSNLVKGAIRGMGSVLDTVYSPHQKPFIEGLFNVLWTKLSVHFPTAQVGRFRGENEAASDLLTACQRGQKDPRKYFPLVGTVLGAFGEAIAEKNLTPVNSASHGRWVPVERFAAHLAETPARQLDAASEWVFSPLVREWTVSGGQVGGAVPVAEGLSVPFEFQAPWLPDYAGCRVKVYFDPAMPRCEGTVCLAQAWNGRAVGTVLGRATQTHDAARYLREVMGWGQDMESAGRIARQQQAAAVRSEVRAVVPSGRGASRSEERDGTGGVARWENEEGRMQSDETGAGAGKQKAESREQKVEVRTRRGGVECAPESVELDPERVAQSEAFWREHALEYV